MIVRIDVQYWALFAEMPLFQSHKETFKDFGFNPLPFLMLRGANIFVLECDTVLHNYDRSHRRPITTTTVNFYYSCRQSTKRIYKNIVIKKQYIQ